MIFQQIRAGGDRNFGYLIGDEGSKEAAVIDPSYSPKEFIRAAKRHDLRIVYVIGTHGHGDHTTGISALKKKTGAKVVMHTSSPGDPDIRVADGDKLELGNLELKMIHTPGHTPDSICILADDKLVAGDTLFVGECGHTRHGSSVDMYHSLFDKLMNLDDDIEIFPGHDYGLRPSSTIGQERRTNYVLEERTLKEFIEFMRE